MKQFAMRGMAALLALMSVGVAESQQTSYTSAADHEKVAGGQTGRQLQACHTSQYPRGHRCRSRDCGRSPSRILS